MIEMEQMRVLSSYRTKSDVEHLGLKGATRTLCGVLADGFMDLCQADERIQPGSPYTCKRCLMVWRNPK